MKRDLFRLSDVEFDLCVIGGGIYGACVAWDATLRGLSVALIDKGDFGHATSFNSQKVIHSGFRYLQNADIARMRESIRERRTWMAIAPHLVHPLPFVIPTYRDSTRPKELLSLALKVYDLISFDRNKLQDPQKHIPAGRIISKREFAELLPGIDTTDLTGAAMFYDGQMHSSERLVISFVKSAAKAGAVVANYVEAIDFLMDGDRATGVRAKDAFTGDELNIRARLIVNTSGPWVNRVLDGLDGRYPKRVDLMKVMYLVASQPVPTVAVGLLGRGSKFTFVTPWHNRSLIGTAELPYQDGELDGFRICEKDVQDFVEKVNRSRPCISLRREDVVFLRGGIVPADEKSARHGHLQLASRGKILDHRKDIRVDGLISAVGVKFTTARSVAERIVDLVFKKLGYRPPKSKSAHTPLYGGAIDLFDRFLAQATAQRPPELDERAARHLVHTYGSAYSDVLKYADRYPDAAERITDDSETLKAEVVHGIREEMAQKLSDVVLRRTDIGAIGHPGDPSLAACAYIMAEEMGWDRSRTIREVDEVEDAFALGAAYA